MENNNQVSKYAYIINDEYIEKGGISSRLYGIKEELDWMRRQSEYAIFSAKYKLRFNLRKGEVYQIDWGINVNHEFSSIGYGVVLANSSQYNPLVLMCPLKAKKSNYGLTSRNVVELGFISELKRDLQFIAVVNQIRPIDKIRILDNGKTIDELNRNGGVLNDSEGLQMVEKQLLNLPEDKVNMIIKMYINMIIEGDGLPQ